jgi:copper transport protein
VRLAAAVWAALWLEGLLEGRRPAWVGWVLGLTLLVTATLTSHSSARPGVLGPIADLVHQLSAGVWAGGLVLLVVSLLALWRSPVPGPARSRLAAEWVARFSGVAAASVGVLLASGLVLAVQQVPSWAGLLLTEYGQTLVVKLLIVFAALGLGTYNALSAPRRAARGGRAAGWVAIEAAAVAGVVFVAALLTELPPATAAANTTAPEQSLALSVRAPGLDVNARLQPARLGTNVFEVTLGEGGQPVRGAQVELTFEPVGGGGLSSRLPLVEAAAGDGRYAASGSGLTRTGPWQILVTVTRPSADPVYTTFDLEIGLDQVVRLPGTPLPANVRAVAWLNQYGRTAVSLLVLTIAAGWGWLVSRSIPGAQRAGLLTVGLLLAALLWMLMLTLTT